MVGKAGREKVLQGRLRSPRMDAAVRHWMAMYMNEAPWQQDGPGMNLAAFVASEVARLATVEMDSRVVGGARGKYLDAQYRRVVEDARRVVEYAAAGGTVVIKPYVQDGCIAMDYVRAGAFFPTAVDAAGRVTGCLFLARAEEDGQHYVRVEAHALEADGYRVRNTAFAVDAAGGIGPDGEMHGKRVPLARVRAWQYLAEELLLTGVTEPLFALLRMPMANTVDPQSPLGVSSYARAAALIEQADRQFGRLLWEMESGERALYVDMRAFAADDTEPGQLPIKRFYRTMDADPAGDALFAEWSPPLRVADQLLALNEILQRVEDACALARGTLSEAPESSARGARTATELKIMRQRTYAMVRDTQRCIEVALRQVLYAMDVWATAYQLCPAGAWEATFAFDDSVVCDRGEEFSERVRLVELGAMQPWELRAWYLGEGEKVAKGEG